MSKPVRRHKDRIRIGVAAARAIAGRRGSVMMGEHHREETTALRVTDHVESRSGADRPGIRLVGAIGAGLAIVAAAMLLGQRLTTVLPSAYVVSIFLVAVLIAAAVFGPWSGLVAAIASFFVFDYFFVEPTFTFGVDDPREVFALGVFLVAAITTGGLAGRLRETADAARRRADTLALLQDFAAGVSATTDPAEIRALVARHVAGCIGATAVLFEPRSGSGEAAESWPQPVTPTEAERRAVDASFAAADPRAVEAGRFVLRPLVTADGVVAVVGLAREAVTAPGGEAHDGLEALLEQAAVALERSRFAEEGAVARAAAEEERLRSALLSSISHDLRTPLATILGSVTSLRQLGDRMEAEDRADLLLAIEEETVRLSRFVADLLVMTRLEAGLDVRRDWIDVGDPAAAAADHLRRVHPDHPIRFSRTTATASVRGEATLFEQVLFNLGDNAAKASPKGAPIEIAVALDGADVVVTITDRGRGLGREEIARLFQQGEGRATPTGQGGLGLAIAGRVIAAMGGSLAAESRTAEVPGTRITLRLPRAESGAPLDGEEGEA